MKISEVQAQTYNEILAELSAADLETENDYQTESTVFFLEDGTIELEGMGQTFQISPNDFCGEFGFFKSTVALSAYVDQSLEIAGYGLNDDLTWAENSDMIELDAKCMADVSTAKWLRAADARWHELEG